MSIRIQNVSKSFGAFKALDDVSLDIESGELIALLSPSGMGKTTLLRIIAGLEWPDSGQVHFHGQDATGTHARDRNVGFVFQHYALFRHASPSRARSRCSPRCCCSMSRSARSTPR
jgi:sulfate transport system ATP-binding protein